MEETFISATISPFVPILELRGWQKQYWNNNWTFASASPEENDSKAQLHDWTDAKYQTNMKGDFWNIGLRCGFDSNWYFSKNWALLGDFSFANLWTYLKGHRTDLASTSGSTTASHNVSNIETLKSLQKRMILTMCLSIDLGFYMMCGCLMTPID